MKTAFLAALILLAAAPAGAATSNASCSSAGGEIRISEAQGKKRFQILRTEYAAGAIVVEEEPAEPIDSWTKGSLKVEIYSKRVRITKVDESPFVDPDTGAKMYVADKYLICERRTSVGHI
jgi:hypothetical protein